MIKFFAEIVNGQKYNFIKKAPSWMWNKVLNTSDITLFSHLIFVEFFPIPILFPG